MSVFCLSILGIMVQNVKSVVLLHGLCLPAPTAASETCAAVGRSDSL